MSASRVVAGIMSGTSLDGVDVALARIKGHHAEVEIDFCGFATVPYSNGLRPLLMEAATRESFSVEMLSQLNVRLAHEYARCVRQIMTQAGVDKLDLVGSHGQTIRHVPDAQDCAGMPISSTLQIGDPSVLANLMSVPVVGDFRMADMALGGQGAPLVPYYDYLVLRDDNQTRGLLNIGGISNLTIIPRGGGPSEVYGFDIGPGNMVIDALSDQLLGVPMDMDGAVAAEGEPSESVLQRFLKDEFMHRSPPKSTGRERYGPDFVSGFSEACSGLDRSDILATATALTARSIYQAYTNFVRPRHTVDVLIVSGGGHHNRTMMKMLVTLFDPIRVVPSDDMGVQSDAKEALCFAVLADATMEGHPTGMPGVTGASRSAIQGKICLP